MSGDKPVILVSTVHARGKIEKRGRRKGGTRRKEGKGGRDERNDTGRGLGWIYIYRYPAISFASLPKKNLTIRIKTT